MAIFEGAGVALVTPMNENLEVNYDKLEELLEEQIAGGTDAIVICGTTGESGSCEACPSPGRAASRAASSLPPGPRTISSTQRRFPCSPSCR